MKKVLLFSSIFIFSLFFATKLNAQDFSQTVKKGFLIIATGKNYNAMKKLAEKSSEKLGYKLDLRGLSPNKKTGLTASKETCEKHDFEYPVYYARGRYDDGNYISIEYTNNYKGFTPDYYFIVVSSNVKGNKELREALKKTKKYYKNAYIKYTDIYMGCMH